jgi:hypothetical protein
MCLSCQYSTFGRCEKCHGKTCYDALRCNGDICDDCMRTMKKKRRCRACQVIFNSGNELFKHLAKYENHNKDYVSVCKKRVSGGWMGEYAHLGFLA